MLAVRSPMSQRKLCGLCEIAETNDLPQATTWLMEARRKPSHSEQNIDPNHRCEGFPPLLRACYRNSIDVLSLLLAHPTIDVTQRNHYNENVLQILCCRQHPERVRFFCQHFSSSVVLPLMTDHTNYGVTALNYVVANPGFRQHSVEPFMRRYARAVFQTVFDTCYGNMLGYTTDVLNLLVSYCLE